MKLPSNPSLPQSTPLELTRLLRDLCRQVNAISEGNAHAFHAAMTAAPTAGDYAVGDFVLNSAPAEAGTAGAKYIVHGWRYTATGWLAVRTLTGN